MNKKIGKQKLKEIQSSSKQLSSNINPLLLKNETNGNPLNSTKHKPKLSQIKNLLSTGSFKNNKSDLEYFESDDKNAILLKAINENKRNVSEFYVKTNKNEANIENQEDPKLNLGKSKKMNNKQVVNKNIEKCISNANYDMENEIELQVNEQENLLDNNCNFDMEDNKLYDEKKEFNIMIDNLILDHISLKNKEKKKTKDVSPEKMMNYSEKNDYQRKVTNNVAIEKFKQQCLQIVKEDEKVKEKVEMLNITDPHRFLDEYLFNDDNFLTRLEYFLLYKNGNTKNLKNNFFRNEILKVINYKTLDVDFNSKINDVISSMNLQFEMIENFKLDSNT